MQLDNITLVRCQSDYDFKEVREGVYQALVKAKNNDKESIVLLELNKELYDEFIINFKKETKLNILGDLQVKKNKKMFHFYIYKLIRYT